MPTPVSVDVTIDEKGDATYKSESSWVQTDGEIDIPAGEWASISFQPADGQTWSFEEPWITIDPLGGDVYLSSWAANQVVIQDNNPQGPPSQYSYCLQTSTGPLDPRIINKGT